MDDSLPDDVETLKQLALACDAELCPSWAEMASARRGVSTEALVMHLRLTTPS